LFGGPGAKDNLVLFLYIDFRTKARDIQGFIALLMDLPSITALKTIVTDYIRNVELGTDQAAR
jgi:chemotaxis protein CheC